ncbi:IS110 family transposase [Paracoccus jeotgali]|uniref:IS110 family transposase n=1 Tax=Paracoccus jeotgali TaxID=2065379 RepID=UPI0028AC224C|nr:IS110 family transposase [Paracoccus jeotgali]
MTYYAGLDVSLNETAICVVDAEGRIVAEGAVPSDPHSVLTWLEDRSYEIERAGLEIGGISRWLHEGLREGGLNAICIDPRRLRALTKIMPVKTDRNDARAIAAAMRVGWYSEVHIKSKASQVLKMLLTNRKILLEKQIDIDNAIRGTLRVFGIKISGRISHATFDARVREAVADTPNLAELVDPLLRARAAMREQYAVLHRHLMRTVRGDEVCRRLMTIPGVGPLVAVTFRTTIDDPDRFRRSRDVGPHLGLTPRKYASGETDRNGAISKVGDAATRAVLYQAGLAVLTRSQRWSKLRAWGMAVAKRRGMRRAVVAVGRKLAILMHRIWKDGTTYTWGQTASAA